MSKFDPELITSNKFLYRVELRKNIEDPEPYQTEKFIRLIDAQEFANKMELSEFCVADIFDLTLDPKFLDDFVNEKIKLDNPPMEECLEAIMQYFEDKPEMLTDILMKRSDSRIKHGKE